MADIASEPSRWGKYAWITVPALMVTGSASGWLSGSGAGNPWYAALIKPFFMPPGWAFGLVWPILYALLGVALAMILALPPSPERRTALILFFAQFALNLAWSPLFFALHAIEPAKYVIMLMALVAALAARIFWRLSRVAGMLLIPYLAWLVFAATLNSAIHKLNPGAGSALLG